MKRLIFLAVLALSFLIGNAQDIIVRRVGKIEKGKVVAVTSSHVKYTKNNAPDSPILSEPVSNVFYIRYEDGRLQTFDGNPKSTEKGDNRKCRFELDLYVQNGWGVGFNLSSEITPFVGCNLLDLSYKTGFNNPKDGGILNIRPIGLRLYTPIYDGIRVFSEVNFGYSMLYVSEQDYKIPGIGNLTFDGKMLHFFGLGFTAGIQFSKRFAIGYNLDLYKNSDWKLLSHWGTLSYLF